MLAETRTEVVRAPLLLAMLATIPAAAASSPMTTDVTWSFEGTGAVGEPITLRLVWRVAPNTLSLHARFEAPAWVTVEGQTEWTLESDVERETRVESTLTLTPTREGYWQAGVTYRDATSHRILLAARSLAADGALAREPYDVIPARAATVNATLGGANATHGEIVVRSAKGAGWSPLERLVAGAAGHGGVSAFDGDAGEHREWLELPEGHALALQAAAYVEARFDGPSSGPENASVRREVRALCYTLARNAGQVTFDGGECRYPTPLPAPLPLAALALAACMVASRRWRA